MNHTSSLAEFVDLPAVSTANDLISDRVLQVHKEALEKELDQLEQMADPAMRAFAHGVIGALARLSAQVTLLQQSLEHTYRSRADRIRIDPPPFIPESRRTVMPNPPRHFELAADSAAFQGSGWYEPETNGSFSWRWSGHGPTASLLLPTLGGQHLRLRLNLMRPFQQSFQQEPISVLVNDARLELSPIHVGGSTALFEGYFDLPEDDGFGNFALVLQTGVSMNFSTNSAREPRQLGIGLHKLMIDRVEGPSVAQAAA